MSTRIVLVSYNNTEMLSTNTKVNNFLINDCARMTDISVIYRFPSVLLVIADLWIHSQEA